MVVGNKARLRNQFFGDRVLMAYFYSGVIKKSSAVMRDSLFSTLKTTLETLDVNSQILLKLFSLFFILLLTL